MRSDQYIGLTDKALDLVRGEEVEYATQKCITTFPNGQTLEEGPYPLYRNTVEREPFSYIEGAWNDNVADLYRYTFEDGRVWEEFVQATPWSSGPMYFVALRDKETGMAVPESLWDEDEIEHY